MMQDNPFADLIPQTPQAPGVIYGRPKTPTPLELSRESRAADAADRAAAAADRAAIAQDRAAINQTRAIENDEQRLAREGISAQTTLRKEFDDRKDVQRFATVRTAREQIRSLVNKPDFTAQDDIALIFSFMRALDPNSVVREGEFATAQNAAGVPTQIMNQYNRILNGERLSGEQRRNFGKTTDTLYQRERDLYNQQALRYRDLAARQGIDPDLIARRYVPDEQPAQRQDAAAPNIRPQGDIEFGNTGGAPAGAEAYQAEVEAGIRNGTLRTADDVAAVAAKYRYAAPDRAETEKMFEALRNGARYGGAQAPQYASVVAQRAEMGRERGDSVVDPFVRGAADTVSLGLADEISGIGNAIITGGNVDENIALQRATDQFDEQRNFAPRISGQIAGGFALPVPAAANTPGRLAAVGAGYGAGYGFGSADGGFADRLAGAAVGGAIGGGVGYAGGSLAQRLAGRGGGGGGPPVDPRIGARELNDAATRQGVSVLPADLGSPLVGRMTAGMAQSPFGSGPIMRAAEESVGSFNAARNRIAGEAGEVLSPREVGNRIEGAVAGRDQRAVSAISDARDNVLSSVGAEAQDITGAGQVAQRGMRQWMDDTKRRAQRLYEQVPIEDSAPTSLNETRSALADLNRGLRSNPELSALFDSPLLQRIQSGLTRRVDEETGEVLNEGALSWGDLSRLRTRIGDMLEDARLSPDIPERQLRTTYAALSRDMEETARQQGGSAYRAWKRANDYYAGREKRISDVATAILGERRDRTANEAFAGVERLMRDAAGGDFAKLGQVFRSLPKQDAQILRASLVARSGDTAAGFSAETFARDWPKLSERAKSYLLPQRGAREIMNETAQRASTLESNPLAGKTGEDVFAAIERMAMKGGDADGARRMLGNLSPEDAGAVRATFISRMGDAAPGAQNAQGNAFSPASFLTRWNQLSPEGKSLLFGSSGGLRSGLDDLAIVANGMKSAQRMAGFSNTGAVNSVNATTGGLFGAMGLLLTGNPLLAAGAASPAAYQAIMSRALTSPRLVRWMTRAARTRDGAGQERALQELQRIAVREPKVAGDFSQLVQSALSQAPGRAAAQDEKQ